MVAGTAVGRAFWFGAGASALLSFLYHAIVPFHATVALEKAGAACISASFAIVAYLLWRFRDPPAADGGSGSTRSRVIAAILWLALFAAYTYDLTAEPLWTSEDFLMLDVSGILHGAKWDPIGTNGDFPSDFLSWAPALTYAITGNAKVAIRIWGFIFNFFTVLLIDRSVSLLSKRKTPFGWLIPAASLWAVHLTTHGDNNWIAAIPLLVAGQFYFTVKLQTGSSRSAPVWAAVFTGLSAWTLYVPMIFAIGNTAWISFRPGKSISRGQKRLFAGCLLLILAPLLGSLIQHPEIFRRHHDFLTGQGEGFRQIGDSLLSRYLETTGRILSSFLARPDYLGYGSWGITLEATTFGLCLLGCLLAPAVTSFENGGLLFLFAVLAWAAVVFSNPVGSVWRTTGFAPVVWILALLGLSGGVGWLEERKSKDSRADSSRWRWGLTCCCSGMRSGSTTGPKARKCRRPPIGPRKRRAP